MHRNAIASMTFALLASAALARAEGTPKPSDPRAEHVFSGTEGERTVVYIAPEGARVTKGQVVCVLDAIPAPDGLKDQKITAVQAEASYRHAKLTREVAEMAVAEYEQGVFRREIATIDGEIALAQAELKRAEDRLAWSRKMSEKKYLGQGQLVSEKFNHDKARFNLEQASARKTVHLKYIKDKTIKELRAAVEKARSDELAKKGTLDLERSKAEGLERQVRACVIVAPVDGSVVLARPTRLVEVGAAVCKDQLLLRVVPSAK